MEDMNKQIYDAEQQRLMSLDEAIQHCIEKGQGCTQCAEEHLQLAEWLKELKQYRYWYKKWFVGNE